MPFGIPSVSQAESIGAITAPMMDSLSDGMSSVKLADGALKTLYSDTSSAIAAATTASEDRANVHAGNYLLLLRDSFVQFYDDMQFA